MSSEPIDCGTVPTVPPQEGWTVADVDALGGELTKLTKDQAEYIGVDVEGPFKPEHYRY